jgi:hypothetical protein
LIITVGDPGGITLPTGAGIGAMHAACEVMSLTRAAGRPPMITFVDPIVITPGPLGTQDGSVHGVLMLPTTAAGMLLIITVIAVADMIVSGRLGWGTGVGTGAGGWIGAWQCGVSCFIMSP